MKKQALIVALLPLFTVACGGMEDTSSNPRTQTTAELSSSDPLVGTWCYYSWGCIAFNSSGYATQLTNSDVCWNQGDAVYSGVVVSTGTDANGNPTYSGTRNYGGSVSRCADASPYSATLVVKTNPSTNNLELTETIQSASVTVITWVRSP